MALLSSAARHSVGLRAAVAGLDAAAWLTRQLAAERLRWSLWLVPALGAGIALYFSLPAEPPAAAGLLALGGAAAAALWEVHRQSALVPAALGVVALALGFGAAQLRTAWVAAPVLSAPHGPAQITGTLRRIERDGQRLRLLLGDPAVADLPPAQTPAKLRVGVARSGVGDAEPGQRVKLRARLLPPPGPAVPGGYDFARRAYFDRLGAVGYVLGDVTLGPRKAAAPLARIRAKLRRQIAASLDQPAEGLAVALLTGKRGHLTESAAEAMRHAGLAHLLAISGLHVGLVVALVFGGLRRAAATVPPVVLRWPVKKLAAVLALGAAGAYTVFVGAPLPTVRAYAMAAIVLVAVLADRQPISMRLVAVAAAAILLVKPEALLGASFQLSFAAVAALVAAYETLQPKLTRWRHGGAWRRPAVYLAGVGISSVVATAATALFVVTHFQRLALFGVVANAVAVPLTAFWVMPWGLVAYCLAPIGLADGALRLMGWGLDAIVAVARQVSTWPGAVAHLSAPPAWLFAAAVAGGCWLVIWQQPWRWLGALPICAALLLGQASPTPVLEIDRSAAGVGIRGPDGTLWLRADSSVSAYVVEAWRNHGDRASVRRYTASSGAGAGPWLRCDPVGCRLQRAGRQIAVLRRSQFIRPACRRSDLVVVLTYGRQPCPATRVIDRARLARSGATSVYAEPTGLRVQTARAVRGARPWVRRRQGQ